MNIGLYFGTYNPIHVGHLVIANYIADYTELDEVWMVVSPQNPLKEKKSLLKDSHRLALVKEGVEDNSKLKACDIEFKLPRPSYTTTTLAYLEEKHPEHTFSLIMGEDNLRTLHKWKNYELILEKYHIYIYPRALTIQEEKESLERNLEVTEKYRKSSNIHFCDDAPVMKISSSGIRKGIKEGKDVRYLLSDKVFKYLDEMNFYK